MALIQRTISIFLLFLCFFSILKFFLFLFWGKFANSSWMRMTWRMGKHCRYVHEGELKKQTLQMRMGTRITMHCNAFFQACFVVHFELITNTSFAHGWVKVLQQQKKAKIWNFLHLTIMTHSKMVITVDQWQKYIFYCMTIMTNNVSIINNFCYYYQ